MGLIQRRRHPKLLVVFGHDRRPLTKAEHEQGLGIGIALDVGQLGGDIGIFGAVGFIGDDLNAHPFRGQQGLGAPRLAKA